MKNKRLVLLLILSLSQILFAQMSSIDWKMHTSGSVRQFITNMGALDDSNNPPYTTYLGDIWSEMPSGSNEEHLYQGGIWIGALTSQGDTLVSVSRNHFTPPEFFPTSQSWDTIWVVGKNQTVNLPFWPDYIGYSDQDFVCRYSDYNILNIPNHVPLYIDILQRSYSWNAGPKSECIILNYYIIPTQFNLSQIFFGFWLHPEIGNNNIGNNWIDEFIHIFPNFQMVIAEDAPGGDDGTAFSPIGIKILEPRDSTLTWTMKYYDHSQLMALQTDEEIYREMNSGDIYPSRLDPERAHILIAFGPFQSLPVNDTLHIELAEIFGESLSGALDNAAYLDSLYSGVVKPDLWITSLSALDYSTDSLRFEYSFGNYGSAPANLDGPTTANSDNVSIKVFYSEDPVFNNGNDIQVFYNIVGLSPLGMLDPGEVFTGTFTVVRPPSPSQTPFLTMMVDWDNVINEIIETNNTSSVIYQNRTTILTPLNGKEYFVLPDTTSTWTGIELVYNQNHADTSLVDFAWSVDDGLWHWSSDTIIYLPPQAFSLPLAGQHLIRVSWGVQPQIFDPRGDSVLIQLIEPVFHFNRLVVDETDEALFTGGLNAFHNQDGLIDSFYTDVFNTVHQWDFKTQGMVPKSVLGNYRLIIWHADNPYSNPQNVHKLPLFQEEISDYLNVGGDIIIGGWRMLSSFNQIDPFPHTYSEGSFIREYLGVIEADETNSIPTDFTWAEGMGSFSDIHVDSAKLSEFPFYGQLGQVNIFLQIENETDSLYTYQNEPSGLSYWRDKLCGIFYPGSIYQTVFIGFPIFFIQKPDAEVLGEEILTNLGYDPFIIEEHPIYPLQFEVRQNFPNPFNPTTVISWQLAVGCQVKLTVYNITGERVAVLVNEKQQAGSHSVKFDASGLASGVYLYRLETEGFVQTKKMILMR